MSSVTSICNRALIRLGAETITDLTEDSKQARILNIIFHPVRKSLLRSHIWNFALGKESLGLLSDAPAFEYDQAFQLPSDCLRVVRLNEFISPWKIVGRELHTNDTEVELIYIKDFDDPEQFDTLFEECLVLKLAKELAYNVSGASTLINVLDEEYKMKIREAKQIDAQEDFPLQWDDGTWINSRD